MPPIETSQVIEGSGLGSPLRQAGAPDGTSYAGKAAPGAILIDTTNTTVYINTGTQAAPTWTKIGTQA